MFGVWPLYAGRNECATGSYARHAAPNARRRPKRGAAAAAVSKRRNTSGHQWTTINAARDWCVVRQVDGIA